MVPRLVVVVVPRLPVVVVLLFEVRLVTPGLPELLLLLPVRTPPVALNAVLRVLEPRALLM